MLPINKYWKGVIAGAGPVLLAVQAAVDNGSVDAGEGVAIGIAVLVALGVIATPNKPKTDPDTLPAYRG
ncbi:hypothetical protein GCM10010402_66000 [Actinomadura luteofluorescens]|uniref:hypothetical protein n=1 Tax=Actinomadura luteofluorescens TaxID=46163 RepID=UPI0021641DFC|nr:hypothetical protein [Actinomadura glauciflava]MCR3744226.1 hypothetical protein [Actinomadura glauciflava]